jgi:hypothetical protein
MANCYFAKPNGMQHCYIPFLYVIDFNGALNFGEAVPCFAAFRAVPSRPLTQQAPRLPPLDSKPVSNLLEASLEKLLINPEPPSPESW